MEILTMTENRLYNKMAECINEMITDYDNMVLIAKCYRDDYISDFVEQAMKLQDLIILSQPLDKIEEFYSVGKLYTRSDLLDIVNNHILDILGDDEGICKPGPYATMYIPMEQFTTDTMEEIFEIIELILYTKYDRLASYSGSFIDYKNKYIIAFN
jgi:hypothetical protein